MNKCSSKILHSLLMATTGIVASTVVASTAAFAGGGPTGGQVAVGSAAIVNASPTQTVVNQSSKKALINWNSFSIPTGSSVQFNQPTVKSLTVNRVTGSNASVIDGQLLANGNIWLLNANGVLFGKGSQINVGSLIATTSDISDGDFASGNYTFKPATNPNAAVVNKGTITVSQGGSVVLSAPQVRNEGLIQADMGTVVLGGANAFTVDMDGDNLLRYEVSAPVASAPKNADGSVAAALVTNAGTIEAAGGRVVMTARAAQSVRDNVINNTGMVEATTVSSHNGEIDLDAGPYGTVNDSGTLDASGKAQGQTGGAVNVTGNTVNIADGAKIDASGTAGGGTVQIGGGLHGQGSLAHAQNTNVGNATIVADATGKGNGGTVVVWSDGITSFAGSISAKGGAQGGNGGQVETSGHTVNVNTSAHVDTTAPLGLTGDWLLDPDDLLITSNTSQNACCGTTSCLDVSSLVSSLATTDMTESANISLTLDTSSNIAWNSGKSLSLLSKGDIDIESSIQNSGTGAVNVIAGWDGSTLSFSPNMSSSIYGQGGGSIGIGACGSIVAIGSKSGQTIVAGYDIQLTAPNGDAQVGYRGAGGGNIAVLALDNLSLSGGEGTSNTAIIGNGVANGSVAGNITGNIYIGVGGYLSADDNSTGALYIGNVAAQNLLVANVTVSYAETGNVTIITDSGDVWGQFLTNDLGTTNATGGNVFLGFTSTIGNFTSAVGDYSSPNTFTVAAAANLTVVGDIVNSGTGNVNVIAGWDGHTTNLAALTSADVANATTYGQNQGAVTLLAADAGDYYTVSVGSAGGKTTVAGYDVSVNGNKGDAQIGYWDEGTGDIAVLAAHDVNVIGGVGGSSSIAQIGDFSVNQSITGSTVNITVIALGNVTLTGGENYHYAQIGNGGAELSGTASGNISVSAGGAVTLNGGDYESGEEAYAQIGNGGELYDGTSNGTVTVNASSIQLTGGYAYAQIGNGGMDAGDSSGDIVINDSGDLGIAGGDGDDGYAQIGDGGLTVTEPAGNITVNATGNVTLLGGDGEYAYAQIGNGGAEAGGDTNGTIKVTSGGNVSLTGGEGEAAYAQVGNGGDGSNGTNAGSVTVNATGSILLQGEDDYAQIGNGGYGASDSSGNITVISGSDLDVYGGGQYGYAQIGNGGYDTTGTDSGTVKATVGGDVSLTGGEGYAQIGNGGAAIEDPSGNITVNATGDITLLGGNGEYAYAQIGNGGAITRVNANGTIKVTSGGNISLTAGDSGGGYAYAQIGNGGDSAQGVYSGNITVNATGWILLQGEDDYAQIGNGGYETGNSSGNITVIAGGDLTLDDSDSNGLVYVQIGNGGIQGSGNVSGNIKVSTGGDLNLTGGEGGTQIGNGAEIFTGNVSGNIAITACGTTVLDSEYGGVWVGNYVSEGTEAGDVSLITGDYEESDSEYTEYDSLGDFLAADILGGNVTFGTTNASFSNEIDTDFSYDSSYSLTVLSAADLTISGDMQNAGTGNITIVTGWNSTVAPANVATTAGAFGNNNASLTIGGEDAEGDAAVGSEGGTTTILTGGLTVDSEEGSAQIGYHGTGGGNIVVNATGEIQILALASDASAQIGNGGIDVSGNITGNISVASQSGGIVISAGADSSVAEIGNFGDGGSSESGNIAVNTNGRGLELVAVNPGASRSFARIGNFTYGDTNGTTSGNIVINAGAMSVLATGGNSFAEIGGGTFHGFSDTGAISGNITINATALSLVAGSGSNNTDQARIGNLGDGAVTGNIDVTTASDIVILSTDGSVSSIGGVSAPSDVHGHAAQGQGSGNITVTSGGNITLISENDGNARISSGGYTSGNITVAAAGEIGLLSGAGTGSMPGATSLIGAILAGNGTVNVNVTSASGIVDLEAADANSFAQIGNVENIASGGAVGGNITVSANGSLGGVYADASGSDATALIGNLNFGSAGTAGGNIAVTSGSNLIVQANGTGSVANIGNIGGDGTSQSGNITVNAAKLLTVEALADGTNAQIGNLEFDTTDPSAFGNAGGNIVVNAGSISLVADGAGTAAQIGNGYWQVYNGNVSGDITIATGNLTLSANGTGDAQSFARIGGRALNSDSANITIAAKNVLLTSGNDGNAIIGQGAIDGPAAGNIAVNATGFVDLETPGAFGQARIGNAGVDTSGNLVVTAAGNIILDATGESALAHIANFGDGTISGNIAVTSTHGNISMTASGDSALAQIGLQTQDPSSTANGNIVVKASSGSVNLVSSANGAMAQIGNGWGDDSSVTGNITVLAGGDITAFATVNGSLAQIGNDAPAKVTGTVNVTAGDHLDLEATAGAQSLIGNTSNGSHKGNVTVTALSVAGIRDSIVNDLSGGNFTLNSVGNGTLTIDTGASYSSAYDLTIKAGGDILVEDSLQNAGSGDITLVSAGDLTIGGAGASGGVALGSKGGLTSVTADDLLLAASNGYAQLGYHGGGTGKIVAAIAGNVTMNGGSGTGYYVQIGDGGYKVTGSSNMSISIVAGGDIALNGGAGQEAYAQIGNGGAESNSNSSGYSETGLVTVSGQSVTLGAGNGAASYAQIGHGGYKSGQSLSGTATIGGDISVAAVSAIRLNGNGADAYAQIGNGGDLVNAQAANGSGGTISGDIAAVVSSPGGTADPVTLTAGSGANSYAQIGNGGQGENSPASGATVTFTVSGDVLISDLTLTGSNTGTDGYAQVGNGDASKTGTGNISGNVTLGQGTKLTTIDGKASGASADLGNATGFGTVTGTIPSNGTNAGTIGSIASITQNNVTSTNTFTITTVTVTPQSTGASDFGSNSGSQGPTPLDKLSDSLGSEGSQASDSVAQSVGQSLENGKKTYVLSQTIIPGVLKQYVSLTSNGPHGVPPADEDYSSWGNEALWRW